MRLTVTELSEPEVILIIPEPKFCKLPKNIQEALRCFIGQYDRKGNRVYKVPGYLYRQWTQPPSTEDK